MRYLVRQMRHIVQQVKINKRNSFYFSNSQFGGICTVARDVGLGEELDLRIGRLDSRCDRYSMNTDAQVRLEMPRIREGIDKLQGMQNEFALFVFMPLLSGKFLFWVSSILTGLICQKSFKGTDYITSFYKKL